MSDVRLIHGDCLDVLPTLPAGSVDAVVTDPPAGISFMGKTWDDPGKFGFTDGGKRTGTAPTVNLGRNPTCQTCGGRQRAGAMTKGCSCESPAFNGKDLVRRDRAAFVAFLTRVMAECLRVSKPGAYALVWAIPRTSHWTATAVEDAGWVIQDRIAHLFGSGFPKHRSKLKPAVEDWWLCWKPARHATPLQIERCRVACDDKAKFPAGVVSRAEQIFGGGKGLYGDRPRPADQNPAGRWPANVCLDSEAARLLDEQAGERSGPCKPARRPADGKGYHGLHTRDMERHAFQDSGGASRFFYCPKASKKDRGEGNSHPTVKPHNLMRWLCRLVTPPGGTVLDPFAGSGSTGLACRAEGFGFVGVEREKAYHRIAKRRLAAQEARADA